MKKSRLVLWLLVLAFGASGIALHLLAPASEGDLPHPLNGLLREIHGVSAMLGVFMFGYMFAEHAQKKIIKGKHHWDGYLHLSLWSLLVASGLLLYYPPENAEAWHLGSIHWYVGVLLCICFPLHFMRKPINRWMVHKHIIKRKPRKAPVNFVDGNLQP